MADQIGSLAPGKQADIVLNPQTLNFAPRFDDVSQVVFNAQPGNVEWVFVDGRVLKEGATRGGGRRGRACRRQPCGPARPHCAAPLAGADRISARCHEHILAPGTPPRHSGTPPLSAASHSSPLTSMRVG